MTRLFLAVLVLLCGYMPTYAQELPARIINKFGMEFVLIKAGTYPACLGQEADEVSPGKFQVEAFYIQTTELTRGQWQAAGLDSRYDGQPPDLPADRLSHGDARIAAQRLSRKFPGVRYRLPRELEWEIACRAGRAGGEVKPEELAQRAWFKPNSGGRVHEVAGLKPNEYGLYDTLGNLFEWVMESYDPRRCPGPLTGDPNGPTRGLYRVRRGGYYGSSLPTARCGWRSFDSEVERRPVNGVRLVREAVPPADDEEAVK